MIRKEYVDNITTPLGLLIIDGPEELRERLKAALVDAATNDSEAYQAALGEQPLGSFLQCMEDCLEIDLEIIPE